MQNARTRERMGALLSKAKQLQQPATPPAAAAPAEGADDDAAAPEAAEQQQQQPAMSAAEKLAVGEEFLKQLGARPLAAALGDLYKLLDAQAGADNKPEVGGMHGLLCCVLFAVSTSNSVACGHCKSACSQLRL
jgi:hypothetical protein